MTQPNAHFKQLVHGAPPEILAGIGSALIALHIQRGGSGTESAPALRQACLELLRWLLPNAQPTAQQQAFLCSGALADQVTLKDHSGQPLRVDLLSAELYELILAECEQSAPLPGLADSLLYPLPRILAIASGNLAPFDFNRPGRFKAHVSGQARHHLVPHAEQLAGLGPAPSPAQPDYRAEMDQARAELLAAQQEQTVLLRHFASLVSGDRLGALLKEIGDFTQFVTAAQQQLANPKAQVERLALAAPEQQSAVQAVERLHGELNTTLRALGAVQRSQLTCLDQLKQLAMHSAAQTAVSAPTLAPPALVGTGLHLSLNADQMKRVSADATGMFAAVAQYLINHPQRTPWSASRVLLTEHFEKIGAEPEDCIATPPRLLAAIRRVQALHPNCFPLDDQGEPVLPPVVIEPGIGLVKWLDDRFLLSFVASDPPRSGPQLSFSPLDQAVLRIYGSFLARGDIWNYRGERLQDSMMAEYAGEIEQKVAVKFTGAEKKLSYGTSAEEKDGASREDAVRDYMDFVFCAFNGQQLPKRITARKAGVFLKYCIFRDLAFTVNLTLHLIAGTDALAARAIILRHIPHDPPQLIELLRQALEGSTVLQTRYRRDLDALLQAVLGREFMDDARDAGLLRPGGRSWPIPHDNSGSEVDGDADPSAAGRSHDYFDL